MSREASRPRLERAIKRSRARHGIQAIFPSHGRWVGCWRFFSFLLKEKKKKRIGGKIFRSTVLNSSCLSQAWPGDTSQLHGGFPLWLRRQPALRVPPARRAQAGLRLSPSSLCQVDGWAADLSERPLQLSFLPARGSHKQRRGSPGVSEHPGQEQRNGTEWASSLTPPSPPLCVT